MPDRYPHLWGGNQISGQSAPPVKGTNGKKLKMLNCKFACISDPAANTMQTAVTRDFLFSLGCRTHLLIGKPLKLEFCDQIESHTKSETVLSETIKSVGDSMANCIYLIVS